ncbi:SusC/RagA family TonB-linked outer membrane protein [Salinibacter ruber]|uniref:TonB-linked SusC/RagA family outer membrane protein n=1 Tax=Salinibacter ruber TaxID=146919 RepID=A0A9X2U5P2_9BACT|nr:TonB-dependent receptor [Salinibacter ruber]MCS3656207.1 TonB-linked SusC/RagA family outer membrane protein [Salinibacter ruber]MCS3950280.1 TonB-linked SusC/RagA family outer membrane protein [Salinibacter ruber]MCS4117043.1 TonB-linked SusC/RagA family outer membrane protein [Salinibacter ruber]MCS4153883.1 TonB-linked SusC/RagA family outer membrane protein [Salinibacter ruber]MCS4169625.1 TonB-linked SusC/RagA family outer membrane protein [Salinibacter ruber]
MKALTNALACSGLLLFLLVPGLSHAQDITVSGTVTDTSTDTPLPGATVSLQGTSQGTATSSDGTYELTVPSEGTLVFSFVGYTTREIPIEGRTTIDVTLRPGVQQLEGVVKVGFGQQQERSVTGSISQVSSEELEAAEVTSFEEALQGRTPGVRITNSSGKLGQGIRVRIRGNSSVTGDNQPLFVVDGTPLNNQNLSDNGAPTNPLAQINVNDIESIEVLKDASATAIYGARASNGVVLITTKQGTSGGSQFSVSLKRGWSGPTNKVDMMNASQYVDYYLEAARNRDEDIGGANVTPFEDFVRGSFDGLAAGTDWTQAIGDNATPVVDTDWTDQPFADNPTSFEASLSARGGDENTTFYISGVYSKTDGILFQNSYDKISGRANVTHSFSEDFEVGTRLNLNRAINERVPNDNSFATPIQLIAQTPISPVFFPETEGVPTNDQGLLTEYRPTSEVFNRTLYDNGLLYEDNVRHEVTTFRTLGNAFAEYDLLSSLSVRGEFGLDLRTRNADRYWNSKVFQFVGTDQGIGRQVWDRIVNYNVDAFLNYNNTFQDFHNVTGTAGMQLQSSTTNSALVETQNFPNNNFQQIDSGADIVDSGGSETTYRFLAYFGRLNYNYDDRYFLQLSGRYEGSSRFGSENRYGFFPAASVGWTLTEEDFFPSTDLVNRLKLRASYGITGNAAIGNFPALGLWSASTYAGDSGMNPSQIQNRSLQWEQTQETTLGLDYGLVNNRITGSIDLYYKTTQDLLLDLNVPATTGFLSQTRNVGEVQNKGIEFLVETQNLTGDFSWSSNFNISFNRNEVTDLRGQVLTGGFVNQAREGEPLGVFYALEYAGVNSENGDALYYVNERDDNGNIVNPDATTNDPNEANRVVIGSPQPDFTGGFGNTFSYKGVQLRVLFTFDQGSQIFDGGGEFKTANGRFRDNQHVSQLDAWEEPGDQTDVPEPRLFVNNGAAESSRYLYDASYVRLKNVNLSYDLPTRLVQRLSVSSARIYVTGQNLLTFTDYRWWDPEANADAFSGNLGFGNEFYTAPQARSVTGGIRLSF